MAAPTSARPGRLLALMCGLVALLYLGVAGTVMWGDAQSQWRPKLGLDLEGGTSITLQPRPAEAASGKVTKENVDRAVEIIRRRVDARGIGEAEVTAQGSGSSRNINISIPGENADLLALVKQTAELRFRQVLVEAAVAAPPVPTPSATGSASPSASASPAGSPSARPTGSAGSSPPAIGSPSPSTSAARGVVPRVVASPSPSGAATTPAAPAPSTPAPSAPAPSAPADPNAVPAAVQAQFAAFTDCAKRSTGGDNPGTFLITCDESGQAKYLLAKAEVIGTEVKGATAGLATNSQGQADPSGGWRVQLEFNGAGTRKFGALTTRVQPLPPPQNQVAIVLDGTVVSAPAINEAITAGSAEITGSFTQEDAEGLASNLRYGALPLAFDAGEELQISPTLGSAQLRAGLIAGAIGLGLVLIYSLAYYRGLGLVTVASLIVAGAITYGAVVLLGNYIGYRLSLAGVAGLIVAIGITADSFVVYFERLRDEVRDGRSLRVAAEVGWKRARRTILAADFVSLLAAVVLYVLSVGSVKGFAFTLGLTTLIDIVVVFLFTKPLMSVLARTKFFGGGNKWSGLSRDRIGGQEPVVATTPIARRRAAAAKEA